MFGEELFRTPPTVRFQARNKNEAVHGAKPTLPMKAGQWPAQSPVVEAARSLWTARSRGDRVHTDSDPA